MHTQVCTVIDVPHNVQLVCRGGAVFAKNRGWRSAPRSCRILYNLGYALYCAVKVRLWADPHPKNNSVHVIK